MCGTNDTIIAKPASMVNSLVSWAEPFIIILYTIVYLSELLKILYEGEYGTDDVDIDRPNTTAPTPVE